MDGLETRATYDLADLEIRQGGKGISGRFLYGQMATIANRGRVRKERVESRGLGWVLSQDGREIQLLDGHDFDKVLARKVVGSKKPLDNSLILTETDDALSFVVDALPETSYVADLRVKVEAGLQTGISPGFIVRGVPDAVREVPEPGNPGVSIREIHQAVLIELSVVTRPAYSATIAELRSEDGKTDKRRYWYPWL